MGASTRRSSTEDRAEGQEGDERGSAAAYTGGLQVFGVCALLGAIAFAVTSFVSATDFDPGFHPELPPGVSAFSGAAPAIAAPDCATLACPEAEPSACADQHCQRAAEPEPARSTRTSLVLPQRASTLLGGPRADGDQGANATGCGAGSGGTEHAVEPAPSRLGELLEYLTSRSTAPA